jgi:hypothetical protein
VKCIDHPTKDIKIVVQYLHGPKNRSNSSLTVACDLDCLFEMLADDNEKAHLNKIMQVLDGETAVIRNTLTKVSGQKNHLCNGAQT